MDEFPLHAACCSGDMDEIRRLLADPKTDPNAVDSVGQNALDFATVQGFPHVIEALLESGKFDVNRKNERSLGNTALHWAAWHGQVSAIQLLIKAGADVDAKNDFGRTPADLARMKHEDMLRALGEGLPPAWCVIS